jgi:predicted phage-related endonuclease
MAAPLFVCDSTDRPAWLLHRRKGLGSSDAPAVLALEKAWGNPYSVACLKRGLAPPDGDIEDELMAWGHYVEEPMIRKFSDETGMKAYVSGRMYRRDHPTLGFQMTTLDGAVEEDSGKVGGIECKLSIYTSSEWEKYGVPEHVVCQDQHTMAVMGWDFVYTLALLDGYRLRWKKVERDAEMLGDVIEPAELEFWTRLQDDDDFDAGIGRPDQSIAFLKHLHPNDDGSTVRLEGEHLMRAMDLWVLEGKNEKEAKRARSQAKNTLLQAVGDATFGLLDDGRRVSLKTTTRKESVSKGSTFRTLRETS